MSAPQDLDPIPTARFKKRKLVHPRRIHNEGDVPTVVAAQTSDTETPINSVYPPEEDNSVSNLKEALRARKRPRDRLKDVARRAEAPKVEAALVEEAPQQGHYSSRFVAQTGQVVDREDNQM